MHLYLTTFCCKSNKIVKIFAQGKLIWIWLKLLQLFHKFNEFWYRIFNLDEILFTARLYSYRIGAFLHLWKCRGDSTPRILALGYDQSCYKICINICCSWLLHHLNSAWHGLRTPKWRHKSKISEKIGPMWQTKYASAVPKNLGLGQSYIYQVL